MRSKKLVLATAAVVGSTAAVSFSVNPAVAAPIPVTNAGFDNTTGLTSNGSGTFANNNEYDMSTNSYVGWKEVDAGGAPLANGPNNIGLINVSPADIITEAISEPIALYVQNATDSVDQTTGHVIAATDADYTLSVWVGNDAAAAFGGYEIALYADNGGVKTLLKQITSTANGGDPVNNSWVQFTLNFAPADNPAAFAAAVSSGSSLGVRLGGENAAGATFYDDVELSFTEVPEPAGVIASLVACATLTLPRSSRRRRRVQQ